MDIVSDRDKKMVNGVITSGDQAVRVLKFFISRHRQGFPYIIYLKFRMDKKRWMLGLNTGVGSEQYIPDTVIRQWKEGKKVSGGFALFNVEEGDERTGEKRGAEVLLKSSELITAVSIFISQCRDEPSSRHSLNIKTPDGVCLKLKPGLYGQSEINLQPGREVFWGDFTLTSK